jgi:hypothetical protein
MHRALSDEGYAALILMVDLGVRVLTVAEWFGLPRSTVRNILYRKRNGNDYVGLSEAGSRGARQLAKYRADVEKKDLAEVKAYLDSHPGAGVSDVMMECNHGYKTAIRLMKIAKEGK